MANETPSRPPPLMENAIKNFHFDFLKPSLICWAWLYSFCSVTLRSGQTCCYYEANFNLLCYLLRFFWCWPWLLYDIADICVALIPVLVILVVCLCILCDTMCWVWLYRSRYMHIERACIYMHTRSSYSCMSLSSGNSLINTNFILSLNFYICEGEIWFLKMTFISMSKS